MSAINIGLSDHFLMFMQMKYYHWLVNFTFEIEILLVLLLAVCKLIKIFVKEQEVNERIIRFLLAK